MLKFKVLQVSKDISSPLLKIVEKFQTLILNKTKIVKDIFVNPRFKLIMPLFFIVHSDFTLLLGSSLISMFLINVTRIFESNNVSFCSTWRLGEPFNNVHAEP